MWYLVVRVCRTKPGLIQPSQASRELVMDRRSPEMIQDVLRRRGHDLSFPAAAALHGHLAAARS